MTDTTQPDWWTPEDYRERCLVAMGRLHDEAARTNDGLKMQRLRAKDNGVSLALSYFDEMERLRAAGCSVSGDETP